MNCTTKAFVSIDPLMFGVRYDGFASHLPYTKNKFARQRYVKIGGNTLYSGSLNRFSRSNVVASGHDHLAPGVKRLRSLIEMYEVDMDGPWFVRMTFGVHLGYGTVRQTIGKRGHVIGGGDDVRRANFDIDNQWVWEKLFLDTCVKGGLLPSDTVNVVQGSSKTFEQVPDFASRFLAFTFVPAELYSRPWTAQ